MKNESGRWKICLKPVANKQYIERLAGVIDHLHKCKATWIESAPVHEVFRGQNEWKGVVEVFTLSGHSKAKKAYGWHHSDGPQEQDERLELIRK